jgi:hypothetical protein
MANINIFSLLGVRVAKGGSDCLTVIKLEVMDDLLRVSEIILMNPVKMKTTIIRDRRPPVSVLYSVSLLYLSS